MFECQIEPRYNETDAMGHIGNTTVPVWFEHARNPLFKLCHPTLTREDWPLIVAKVTVDYRAQTYYEHPVTVKSWVKSIGGKSFVFYQELYQQGQLTASGETVLVWYNYAAATTEPLPGWVRDKLSTHLLNRAD
jgi:acyl-CoA thioester hydrolase